MSEFATTQYGFRWNAAEVTRIAAMPDGSVCIQIKGAGKQEVDVYVSAAGRSVRVFGNHGKRRGEWTPPPQVDDQ